MTYSRLLKDKVAGLTPSQEKLLSYILANDDEAVFMTVHELSERVQVSVATVVRLAKSLGFAGFPQFQQELRVLFREKMTTVSRLRKAAQEKTVGNNVLSKVMHQDIENITETLKQVSAADFKRFVNILNSGKRIVIVGLRSAHSLAVLMGVALEFLQRDVWIVTPGIGDMWDRLFGLRKDDVVVGICFPRYTKETIETLRLARGNGIKTLAITDSLISPAAHVADCVLPARCKLDSYSESFTAALSLINAVVTAVGVNDNDATIMCLNRMDQFWKERKIYYEKDS